MYATQFRSVSKMLRSGSIHPTSSQFWSNNGSILSPFANLFFYRNLVYPGPRGLPPPPAVGNALSSGESRQKRRCRLTSLAPDIIDAILRGHEPDGLSRAQPRGLSLEKLRKNLPVRWEEQRKAWSP
jgi:hypothetical protein